MTSDLGSRICDAFGLKGVQKLTIECDLSANILILQKIVFQDEGERLVEIIEDFDLVPRVTTGDKADERYKEKGREGQ